MWDSLQKKSPAKNQGNLFYIFDLSQYSVLLSHNLKFIYSETQYQP